MKERIYAAALELFEEKGFDQTSIEEITERADVARGTFFTHFHNKDALVCAWSANRRAELEERLRKTDQGPDEGCALNHCVKALVDVNGTDGERLNGVMVNSWVKAGLPITETPDTAEVIADLVSADIAAGRIAADVDPLRVGHLLRDAYLGALFRQGREGSSNAAVAEELHWTVDVLLHGIAGDRN
jgi:AcrR family transcriptional regulator